MRASVTYFTLITQMTPANSQTFFGVQFEDTFKTFPSLICSVLENSHVVANRRPKKLIFNHFERYEI